MGANQALVPALQGRPPWRTAACSGAAVSANMPQPFLLARCLTEHPSLGTLSPFLGAWKHSGP